MRELIRGQIYDTETATYLGSRRGEVPYNDGTYLEETLFRTQNNYYFLLGEGSSMSCYARREGKSWKSGELIRPLDEAAAKLWSLRYLAEEVYEDLFKENAAERKEALGNKLYEGMVMKR